MNNSKHSYTQTIRRLHLCSCEIFCVRNRKLEKKNHWIAKGIEKQQSLTSILLAHWVFPSGPEFGATGAMEDVQQDDQIRLEESDHTLNRAVF
ncbi:hypothetical protein RUM43_014488 [Polyplax serrata]|uniref:Uncharacterized protein n=1 Tax=Polyplax serrata TaxID=468196 RepID=A0AAN8NZR6_POLSC